MTSQKKIATITRAANRLDCSVVLKVGSPPGIMLCEGAERDAAEWESVVRVSSKNNPSTRRQIRNHSLWWDVVEVQPRKRG